MPTKWLFLLLTRKDKITKEQVGPVGVPTLSYCVGDFPSPLGWGPKHQNIFRYLATNTNTNRLSPVLVATIELNQEEYLLNNVVSRYDITQLKIFFIFFILSYTWVQIIWELIVLKKAPTYDIFSCHCHCLLSASWSKHVAENAGKSDKSALCLGEWVLKHL